MRLNDQNHRPDTRRPQRQQGNRARAWYARRANKLTTEKRAKRDWEEKFLDALAKTGNVSKAAKTARVSRTIAYELRNEAPDFSAAWDEALETAVDTLELEAWRRAAKGVRKPTGWYQGIPGGYTQEYSDTLLIFLLKAHRPERFRENINVTSGGQPIAQSITYIKEMRPDSD